MVQPALEVLVTRRGSHSIDDEPTTDGQRWLEAFRGAAETIPGVIRTYWARSNKGPNIWMRFIGMPIQPPPLLLVDIH